jgi:hypothetical protein
MSILVASDLNPGSDQKGPDPIGFGSVILLCTSNTFTVPVHSVQCTVHILCFRSIGQVIFRSNGLLVRLGHLIGQLVNTSKIFLEVSTSTIGSRSMDVLVNKL